MNYNLGPAAITKAYILNNVSEEKIMEHYLGIPVKKGLFKSPLRKDTKPTCSFYRNSKGSLIFKDFSGSFHGNFIDVVMHLFNCTWKQALTIVANDFDLQQTPSLSKNPKKIKEYTDNKLSDSGSSMIQVEIQEFTKEELVWWDSFGISPATLKKYNVFSCKNVFLNGNIFHLQKSNQLVFGYYNGKKENVEQWRIYFPKNIKYRFISNWKSDDIQGVKQACTIKSDYIVITKSMKDCMLLHELSVPAIAPLSETLFLTDDQYNKLKEKYNTVILFYDNDCAGIRNMNKIRKRFKDLSVVFIPKKYKCKDISDFYKKYGKDKTQNIINLAKQFIDGKKQKLL